MFSFGLELVLLFLLQCQYLCCRVVDHPCVDVCGVREKVTVRGGRPGETGGDMGTVAVSVAAAASLQRESVRSTALGDLYVEFLISTALL